MFVCVCLSVCVSVVLWLTGTEGLVGMNQVNKVQMYSRFLMYQLSFGGFVVAITEVRSHVGTCNYKLRNTFKKLLQNFRNVLFNNKKKL